MINCTQKKLQRYAWLLQTSGVLTISRSATQQLTTADRTPQQEHSPQVLIYNARLKAHALPWKSPPLGCWGMASSSPQTPHSSTCTVCLTERQRHTEINLSRKGFIRGSRKIHTSVDYWNKHSKYQQINSSNAFKKLAIECNSFKDSWNP